MLRWTTDRSQPRRLHSTLAAVLLLSMVWAAQTPFAVRAESFTVTKTADSKGGSCDPGDCSLREAIIAANASPGPDTITLDAATYTLSITGGGDATVGDLNITGDLTITGALSTTTIIDANKIDRVFSIDALSQVHLANLTIRNGAAPGGSGGGIANLGDLHLDRVIVENSTADYAGGIYNLNRRLDANNIIVRNNKALINGGGGIVATDADVRMSNSLVIGNHAAERGGGIYAANSGLTLNRVAVRDNSAATDGGGLFTHVAGITIIDSSFSGNSATGDGGGIFNLESGVSMAGVLLNKNRSQANGGGLVNSAWTLATLRDVAVLDNRAVYGGGGIVNRDDSRLTLLSSVVRTNQSAYGAGLFNVVEPSTQAEAHILDSMISENTTAGVDQDNGGGIFNNGALILTDTLVLNNRAPAGFGGGIFTRGTLQLSGATVATNVARYGGGVFAEREARSWIDGSSITDNSATTTGGGLYSTGAFTLTNSSILTNTSNAEGGGLIFTGLDESILRNSTIGGNRSGATGGGLYNSSTGSLTLNNLTIANNTANGTDAGNGGGGIGNPFGTVKLGNTIVAGNANSATGTQEEDCAGTLTSQGYNLIQQTAGCTIDGPRTGDITGQDAQLGPLQNNGGRTLTYKLLTNSPAIDAGSPAAPGSGGSACAASDQRGVSRPQGVRCDIGAVERQTALSLDIDFENGTTTAGVAFNLDFKVFNPIDQNVTQIGFTSVLSEGLVVASDGAISNTCGGNFSAPTGGSSIALNEGRLASNQSCVITVAVVAPIGGAYGGTSGPITGNGATSGAGATALVQVNNPVPLLGDVQATVHSDVGEATLTISGTGFVPVSIVMYESVQAGITASVPLPTTFISSTLLRATVATAQLASLSTASVTVVNPSPGGGGSNTQTVNGPPLQRTYVVYLPVALSSQ